MKFATIYNYREAHGGHSFATRNDKESLTVQADANDLNINNIMGRYAQTGQLPRINSAEPSYGDFTQVGDYRDCLEKVKTAREIFDAVPAKIRKRFGNDPAQFMEFVQDDKNKEEMEKLGLTKPKEAPYSKDTEAIINTLRETQQENEDGGKRQEGPDGHSKPRKRKPDA